jgi:hypothetical protein
MEKTFVFRYSSPEQPLTKKGRCVQFGAFRAHKVHTRGTIRARLDRHRVHTEGLKHGDILTVA